MKHFLYGIGVLILGFIFMLMVDIIPGGTAEERAMMRVFFAILYLSSVVTVGLSQVITILKENKTDKSSKDIAKKF